MQGVLLVDKPSGWTSFDVVNFVRKQVAAMDGKKSRQVKVGHTGTLDPLATGLLVVLVGKAYTRQAAELSKHDKTYEVTIKLGEVSTTGDEEGEKTAVSSRVPDSAEIDDAMQKFTGNIMQIPPAYSAIKIHGQKSYDLARKGKIVTLEPRLVKIYDIREGVYEYPLVRFTCDVGSGTYIRSLAKDIGTYLGTGAYMLCLRRTRVGQYQLTDAVDISDKSFVSHIHEI